MPDLRPGAKWVISVFLSEIISIEFSVWSLDIHSEHTGIYVCLGLHPQASFFAGCTGEIQMCVNRL